MSESELYTISWAWKNSGKNFSLVGTKTSCNELYDILQMGQDALPIAFLRITVAASGDPVREFILDPITETSTKAGLEISHSFRCGYCNKELDPKKHAAATIFGTKCPKCFPSKEEEPESP